MATLDGEIEDVDWDAWKNTHRRKFDFVEMVYRALIICNFGLGIAIAIGGVTRFPLPTYKPLLDLTGGDVWPWSLSILIAGALLFHQSWWVNMAGLGLSLLWMNLFSVMFFMAYQYPTSASTAPIPYAVIAMIIVAMMTYKVVERRARRE